MATPTGTTEDPRAPNGPLNILCKWRQAYVMMATSGPRGFQRYVRDNVDGKLLMRAELTAVANLLIQKGIITEVELFAQMEVEAEQLSVEHEKFFPGFSASSLGLTLNNPAAGQTISSWSQPHGA